MADDDPLAEMDAYFDDLLAKMQTPEARAAVDKMFAMTPEEIAEAVRLGRAES